MNVYFPSKKYKGLKGNFPYITIEMAVHDSRKLRVYNCLFSPNEYRAPEGYLPYGTKYMAVKYFKVTPSHL